MSFVFDVLNGFVLLGVFIVVFTPGLGIAFVIGEAIGRKYALLFAVIYSPFCAAVIKVLLPHVPLLG